MANIEIVHAHSRTVSSERPAPTIKTHDRSRDQVWYEFRERRRREREDKPPYRVPSTTEIAALPRNGLTVVSTFSGCGGSCLGFEMAGYTVLYANEFVPAARETYAANHRGVFLDDRDIRQVTADEILQRIGRARGDVDVLEGSPPCASFSTAGKRSAGWGDVRKYSDTKQRVDDLFFEFARIVDGVQPRVFIAENVSGLVKGVAKGYFKEILAALKACGYLVEARMLDAQWLGVPQARQRIIFVGVRDDLAALGARPAFPTPLTYRYSVRDAIPWIDGVDGRTGPHFARTPTEIDAPMNSITVSDPEQTRYEVVGGQKAPFGAKGAPVDLDAPLPTVLGADQFGLQGHQFEVRIVGGNGAAHERKNDAYSIDEPARTILGGGTRDRTDQMFVETRVVDDGPSLDGTAIGAEWDRLVAGQESDRYYNLKRTPIEGPSQTVTAMGGSSPGVASVTHPVEKRKFTIAELRRIGSFPDDFVLTGTYAQQWERIGRAVPPVMMRAVAQALLDGPFKTLRERDP